MVSETRRRGLNLEDHNQGLLSSDGYVLKRPERWLAREIIAILKLSGLQSQLIDCDLPMVKKRLALHPKLVLNLRHFQCLDES